jgi:hypothetical protein
MLRLIKHAVPDPKANNWTALTYLIPEQWGVQEQLYWLLEDITSPVRFFTKLQNPQGTITYDAFPIHRVNYSHHPSSGSTGYPPPPTVQDGIKWIISQVRPNVRYTITNMGILKGAQNNVQRNYDNQSITTSASAWVRIAYSLNNTPFEEEFCGTFSSTTTYISGGYTSISWGMYDMYAYRSLQGKLAEARKIGLTITNSFRIDPHWFEYYMAVIQIGVKGFFINLESQRQLSNTILNNHRQISVASQAAFNERMASQDRINEQFRDVLGGVERYYDPKNHADVQLPLGYANAWINEKGDTYLISEVSGYNPNENVQLATQGWHQVKRKQ